MTRTTSCDSRQAEVRTAASLVKDLFHPDPRQYWRELTCTGTLAWAAAGVALAGVGGDWGTIVSVAAAAVLWHRATTMVHELTHQRHDAIPGFHLAWNLLIGVAWMFPSAFYEGVHSGHHRRTSYGTVEDPEYLQLGGNPWLVVCYIASAFVLFPLLAVRFLVLTPLSWCCPPLSRFLFRYGSSYVINPRYARRTTAEERRRLQTWGAVIAVAWWVLIAFTIAIKASLHWLVVWYAIHTGTSLINRLRMMTAHQFRSDGHPTDLIGQVSDTIDSPRGWLAELWAPLGLRYHALHHLFPRLPFHAMGVAYRRLRCGMPADSVYRHSTGTGWLRAAVNLLRVDGDACASLEYRPQMSNGGDGGTR
jgi:fatty acid desaturase